MPDVCRSYSAWSLLPKNLLEDLRDDFARLALSTPLQPEAETRSTLLREAVLDRYASRYPERICPARQLDPEIHGFLINADRNLMQNR